MSYDPPETKNTNPDKGYVDIEIDGLPTVTDTEGEKHPTEGMKAMNIKNYGCVVVRWRGGKTYHENMVTMPFVFVEEHQGKFVLIGRQG